MDDLKRHGLLTSMARADSPCDNATMENSFKTLKHEEANLCGYETYQDVAARLHYFLGEVHNHNRLHSALGSRPQDEFEEAVLRQEQNDEPARLS